MKAVMSALSSCIALSACVPDAGERIPVVDAPVCLLPEEAPSSTPTIVERTSLVPAAGCNSTSTTASDLVVTARRGDGTLDENNFYVEQRVIAFEDEGECEIHIETHAWERKLEELRAVEPVAAQVTLCGARVTTSYAHALGSAAPALEMLRVGVNHDDAPPDLTTIVGTPQPMPVEDASVRVVCGDAGDAFAHVERYGFHHKVIVRMSKEDALRLAWDGAIEVSLDVLYE